MNYSDEDDLRRLLTEYIGQSSFKTQRDKYWDPLFIGPTKQTKYRKSQYSEQLWKTCPRNIFYWFIVFNILSFFIVFLHIIILLLFNLPLAIISLLCVPSFLFLILFIYLKAYVHDFTLIVTNVKIYLYDAEWRPTLDVVSGWIYGLWQMCEISQRC